MSEHVFHFYGAVTPFSFQNLKSVIMEALQGNKNTPNPCEKVTLLLSSEGGDLNSGFTAYSFLRALPVPVKVINMGTIESIAMMIYLAADERFSVDHGRFLLHSFHWGFGAGAVDHSRISEHTAALTFDAEKYAKIFDGRTQGAQSPIDVRKCLSGDSIIVDSATAITSGISFSTVNAEGIISLNDVHWWPQVYK